MGFSGTGTMSRKPLPLLGESEPHTTRLGEYPPRPKSIVVWRISATLSQRIVVNGGGVVSQTQSVDGSQRDYLRQQIADRLTRLNSSVEYYRGRHYNYQSSAVILSAAITVFSGLKLGHLGNHFAGHVTANGIALGLTDVVLFLGAVSTVLAAYGAF